MVCPLWWLCASFPIFLQYDQHNNCSCPEPTFQLFSPIYVNLNKINLGETSVSYINWGMKFPNFVFGLNSQIAVPLHKEMLEHSVQFSSVVSDSLQPLEPQHARLPCPWPTRGVYPNPCPLSRWCHPTISSSVVPFSSCPQSFPAVGLFKWVSSSHQVAQVLEFQLQHKSFQWIFRTDFL